MGEVTFHDVSKRFTLRVDGEVHQVQALDRVNFSVRNGEIVALIGPSGCGKTTALRIAMGLETASGGKITVDGREVRGCGHDRGMVFQFAELLPWLTALQNVMFGLEMKGMRGAELRDTATRYLELVGLSDSLNRRPHQLSGGMKQRVGIARALATGPDILLCDEATSALDPETTRSILALIADLNRELGLTIVLITHEMSVVRQLAREVVVLDAGHVVESGQVADIFTHPKHPITQSFLAEVIGDSLPVSLASRIVPEPAAGGQAVIRVQVRGAGAGDTLVARLARELGLDVGLLAARIDEIGGQHVGSLTLGIPLGISSGEDAVTRTLAWLSQYQFPAERLGYVA